MFSVLLVSLVTMASPAGANPSDATPPPKKEKKICRTEVRTGSIISQTTCRTEAEWDAMTLEQQNMMRPINRASLPGASPGP